ncbi:hypothetical protein BDV95DRAFT_566816 [Massariosphaeria phaeospora]|uniref:Uncharacterized protein n=1 Tax=Massariosphaeria phaeospora TaxID=100035 RepID=A0A7C8MCA3_9PLEO|nr:hypothetical protein BDV95DRAFT_566816 [Massariosphaeria phaeospora]
MLRNRYAPAVYLHRHLTSPNISLAILHNHFPSPRHHHHKLKKKNANAPKRSSAPRQAIAYGSRTTPKSARKRESATARARALGAPAPRGERNAGAVRCGAAPQRCAAADVQARLDLANAGHAGLRWAGWPQSRKGDADRGRIWEDACRSLSRGKWCSW